MNRWLMSFVALLFPVLQAQATELAKPEMDDPVLEEMIDLALLRAVELAHGLLQRQLPKEAWEENLAGVAQLMQEQSGMDREEAELIVDTARDLLRDYGDNPELIQAMLDDLG